MSHEKDTPHFYFTAFSWGKCQREGLKYNITPEKDKIKNTPKNQTYFSQFLDKQNQQNDTNTQEHIKSIGKHYIKIKNKQKNRKSNKYKNNQHN